ncbi:MAG: peptidoglycan-associated lipoprotein Pal [Gemmobacter sp.]
MTPVAKALLFMATLALAACNNPDRFGAGGSGGLDGSGGAGGIDTSGLGSAGDPNSPAYFAQTLGDRVFFAVDQSTLSAEAMTTLNGQAQWLNNQGRSYAVIVEGHADEQGTREYNQSLSARRAAAAQNYLISQGVSAGRLRTVAYGKERPVEVCSVESCYAKNRRAVTVLSAGAGV